MKKYILIFALSLISQLSFSQNIEYNIFATCIMNLDTGEYVEDVKQNFMTITKKSNVLKVESSFSYNLYNHKKWADGFKLYDKYDAIDEYQQRCTILFQTNNAADWSMKHLIIISYETHMTFSHPE
ncbi:MAG: hypothetical protein SNJ29_13860 [Rikenellaceae bacterium]